MSDQTNVATVAAHPKLLIIDPISDHRKILDKKGLKALGKEATPLKIRIAIYAVEFFSVLTVIFAIPTFILASHYFKVQGRKVIDKDNISAISKKCLFTPTEKEKAFLENSALLSNGSYLKESSETYNKIQDAHNVYNFAKSLSDKNCKAPIYLFLKNSKVPPKQLNQFQQVAREIQSNKYTFAKIPSSFKNALKVNEILDIPESNKEAKEAAKSLLNMLSDNGKELLSFDQKKIEQFSLIMKTFNHFNDHKSEGEKPLEAATLLLSLVIKLYKQDAAHVAKALVKAFSKHSYLRTEIVDSQDTFIIKYNELIKKNLSKLKTKEQVDEAISTFQKEFNRPDIVEKELQKKFGEENAELVKDLLKKEDPGVVIGETAFADSTLAEKSFADIIKLGVPKIAEEIELPVNIVEKILITDDLTQDTFVQKRDDLKKLKAHFDKTKDPALAHEFFLLYPQQFLRNVDKSDYFSDWEKTISYAQKNHAKEGLSNKSIAKAYFTVLEKIKKANKIDHKEATIHMGHACDWFALRNTERREKIRKRLDNEVALVTLQEKLNDCESEEVNTTIAEEYSIEEGIFADYIKSPKDPEFTKQLLTLKKLSNQLSVLYEEIKNPLLINEFVTAYGLEEFLKEIGNEKSKNKLKKILIYGNTTLLSKKVYNERVVAKGLALTYTSLQSEENMRPEDALEALYQAATSFIDYNRDIMVKHKLQEKMLFLEIESRAQEYANDKGKTFTEASSNLVQALMENFEVTKEVPKVTTIDYIASLITASLDSHFNESGSDTSIALAFASSKTLDKKISSLDKKKKLSNKLVLEEIKDNIQAREKMHDVVTLDNEKMLFPLLIKLLPTFCDKIIPEDDVKVQRELQSKLNNINKSFDHSKTLSRELKDSYEHVSLIYTWMSLGPKMLAPFIDTALNLVISELRKTQKHIHNMKPEEVSMNTMPEVLSEINATTAMQTFLPMVAQMLTILHNKQQKILELRQNNIEAIIVTEGSEEEQDIDDYTNVVVFTPLEKIILDILTNIPSNESTLVKMVNKAPTLLTAGGGIGGWFAKKIGTSLIKKQLNENFGIDEHHHQFIKSNIENFVSIGLTLAPYLLKRHNVSEHIDNINAIKEIILSEGRIDQKTMLLKLLQVSETFMLDLKEYQPTILASLGYIHKNI